MAERKASLIIELKDKLSGGINSLKGRLSEFRVSMLAVGAAVTAVTAFLVSAFKAYAENEAAVNKLNTALKNQGIFTQNVSNDLQEFATQLSRQTVFTDEAILRSQALFATFGFGAQEIKKATEMAANLSATLGIDLHQATMLVGKALQGQEGALTRYGLTLADVEKMSGAAAAQLNTVAGRMQNLTNRVGELHERIGSLLLPIFETLAEKADRVVTVFEKLSDSLTALNVFRTIGVGIIEVFQNMGNAILSVMGLIPGLGKQAEIAAKLFNASMDAMQANLLNFAEVDKQVTQQNVSNVAIRNVAQDEELQKALTKNQEMLTNFMTHEEEVALLREFYKTQEAETLATHLSATEAAELTSQMNRLNKLGQFAESSKLKYAALAQAQLKTDQDLTKKQLEEQKLREQNWAATLQTIATLSTSHNKTLAAIGKASAIAIATIDTYAGIGKAWALGPFIGPPLAALVAAAGFANVAKIVGVKLAEGGIVMPTSGGTLARIGEGGSREAVIPLDDPDTKEELADTFGGNTIVINAGTVIADRVSIQEFARLIDDELFRLRKNKLSVALD